MRKLMVREEEGNSLLWNSDDQSKVIQLLFNPPGFFDKYKDVQKQASEANSKANRNRDLKAPFKTKMDVLKEEKEKEIQRIVGESNHFEINSKYEKLNSTIGTLEGSQGKLYEDIEYLNGEIRSLEERYNGLSSDLEITREQITQLEYKYFDSIYHDPRISLIYNKIDQRNSCIFCKNNVNADVKAQIINSVKHNSCPVCSNSLTKKIDAVLEIPEMVVDKIESLRQQSHQKEMEANKVLLLKKNAENNLSEKWDEQKVMTEQLSTSNLELNEIKLVLEQLKKDYEPTNQYDKAIKSYEQDIESFNLIIVKQNNIFKEKKKELTNINNELNKRIDLLTTKLSNIFNKYSKHFYFKNLQLISYEGRKPRIDSKVRLTSFCPIFGGKERKHQQSVSKSEGILLEYLFRMSLIKLYHTLTNVQPFLILESSEGSFDIVRTSQLANVLKKFSENTFPFISITNLSKPAFVKSIINKLKSPKDKAYNYKKRLLNFIDVGLQDELTDKQKKLEKEKYTAALKELGL
jgi:DNA repair exonuclease SbcCD ATPase subunit